MSFEALKHLRDAQSAHKILMGLWGDLKPYLMAGYGFQLIVKPEGRNTAQNALLHALLDDIAKTHKWAGQKWDVEDWKRLMTAAWLRSRNESVAMVPALDGHGFDVLYRRTSKLTKPECAELIDYVTAWAVEHAEAEATA